MVIERVVNRVVCGARKARRLVVRRAVVIIEQINPQIPFVYRRELARIDLDSSAKSPTYWAESAEMRSM